MNKTKKKKKKRKKRISAILMKMLDNLNKNGSGLSGRSEAYSLFSRRRSQWRSEVVYYDTTTFFCIVVCRISFENPL